MQNMTKYALKESLKRLMLKKSLDRITINDLTSDCGISRMTFYYHFRDIYDLAEWTCLEESRKALQGKKTYDTWQEGLVQILRLFTKIRLLCRMPVMPLEEKKIENYLFKLTHDLIMGVVQEQSAELSITEEQKNFIADFYKYSLVGILLDWISRGMKDDYQAMTDNICTTLQRLYCKFYS